MYMPITRVPSMRWIHEPLPAPVLRHSYFNLHHGLNIEGAGWSVAHSQVLQHWNCILDCGKRLFFPSRYSNPPLTHHWGNLLGIYSVRPPSVVVKLRELPPFKNLSRQWKFPSCIFICQSRWKIPVVSGVVLAGKKRCRAPAAHGLWVALLWHHSKGKHPRASRILGANSMGFKP